MSEFTAGCPKLPVSQQEVRDWADRVGDISSAVREFLTADPEEDARRKERRQEKVRLHAIEQDQARRQKRYNTEYYRRFEDDKLIDTLLAEVDAPSTTKAVSKRPDDLTRFEEYSLEEAVAMKTKGNQQLAEGDAAAAVRSYDVAVGLDPQDVDLQIALRNNRALARLRTGDDAGCVEDATVVLQAERFNVKARLRRATALLKLHRPTDALDDVEFVLRGDTSNTEGLRLRRQATLAKEEFLWAEATRNQEPEHCERVVLAAERLRHLCGQCTVEESSTAVCEAYSLLTDGGAAAVFRFAGGTDVVESLLLAAPAITQEAEPERLIATASALRVLARSYDATGAALMASERARADSVLAAAMDAAQSVSPVLCLAGLDLCASLALSENARVKIAPTLTAAWLIKQCGDVTAAGAAALRLADRLLRTPEIFEQMQSEDWRAPVLHYLRATAVSHREAGAGVLVRLSVSPTWTCRFSQDGGTNVLCDVLAAEGLGTGSFFVSEALLAALHNAAVHQERQGVVAALDQVRSDFSLSEQLVQFLISTARKPHADVISVLNVLARCAGVVAKCITASSVLLKAVRSNIAALAPLLSIARSDGLSLTSDRDYADGVAENTALIIAAAVSDSNTNSSRDVALSQLATVGVELLRAVDAEHPRTSGNVAVALTTFLSVRPTEGNALMRDHDGPRQLLDALKGLCNRKDDIERNGLRGSPEWATTRGAIKNLSITVGRCCQDEGLLATVRSLRGFEILAHCQAAINE